MISIGRLHVITDTLLQRRFDHAALAERAIEGGAEVVQYREKVATTQALIQTACSLLEISRRRRVAVIVNDRADVAWAADADGVHVGTEDLPISMARRLLGPAKIVGGSADDVEQALEAARAGADYVGIGPIFPTSSKGDAGIVLGIDRLARAVALCPVPLIAIGGISLENVDQVLATGVHGIAVLSAVCCADDPAAATAAFRRRLDARGAA